MAIDQSAQMAAMNQMLQEVNRGKLARQQDALLPRGQIANSPRNAPQRSHGLAGWYELNPQARPGLSYAQEQANMRNQAFRSTLPNNGNPQPAAQSTQPAATPSTTGTPAPANNAASSTTAKWPQGLVSFIGDLFKKTGKFIDENNNGIPDDQEGDNTNSLTGMPMGTMPDDPDYNRNWNGDNPLSNPSRTELIGSPTPPPTGAVTTDDLLPTPPTMEQLPEGGSWVAPPVTGPGAPAPAPVTETRPTPNYGSAVPIPGAGSTFGPLNVIPTAGTLHQLANLVGTRINTGTTSRATRAGKVVNDAKMGREVAKRSAGWARDQFAKGNITRGQLNKALKSSTNAGGKAVGALKTMKPIAKSTANAAAKTSKVANVLGKGAGASKFAPPLQAALMAAEAINLARSADARQQASTDYGALDQGDGDLLSLSGALQGGLNPISTMYAMNREFAAGDRASAAAKAGNVQYDKTQGHLQQMMDYRNRLLASGFPEDQVNRLMLQFRREQNR